MNADLEARFARLVEAHVRTGVVPSIDAVVADRPDLGAPLAELMRQYLAVSEELDAGPPSGVPSAPSATLTIDGFQTLERLGRGGMGEVYKLRDLTLDRFVAAKVVRADGRRRAALSAFLREAKAMALFADRRVVQIHEFRADAVPPVIIMEYVDGFELGQIGPSLEPAQQARIMREIAAVVQHAHDLGIQHRDLKPSNVMLDGSLSPKILDFGLSAGDAGHGHLVGTPSYLAPEQLDPALPIDARTDVYALGVMLYELITGTVPYAGRDIDELVAAIRAGVPRLPVEVTRRAPEPLQAIALKAMERDPGQRYQSAREMALDLGRYLDGRPVTARPSQYAATLDVRTRSHLDQIADWLRIRLIHPHEAERLRAAYRQFDEREDDWIAAGRALSYSRITLYFGAFLLFAGGLFYFVAQRVEGAIGGLVRPALILGLPWIGLTLAGWRLYRSERQAVAVAFFLAGVSLLPLLLLIWMHEAHLWVLPDGASGQLLPEGGMSNRQLQVTIAASLAWAGWLALRTRTATLSTVSIVLLAVLVAAILGDVGLRDWIDAGRFDRVALHVWPLAVIYAALAVWSDTTARAWLGRPAAVAAALAFVMVLDLLALDGRTMAYLDLSLARFQAPDDPVSIDTLTALAANGVIFYLAASGLERWGRQLLQSASTLLFVIAPFSTLEPLAYLVETGAYKSQIDWLYLLAAILTGFLSHHRQRQSFYYAGLINTGVALFLIAVRRDWFDRPLWATVLVMTGVAILAVGFVLDARERRRQRPG